jgi:hypothetical protein
MSAKERVLAHHPHAEAYKQDSVNLKRGGHVELAAWTIYQHSRPGRPKLGEGKTADEAWEDAAAKLPRDLASEE